MLMVNHHGNVIGMSCDVWVSCGFVGNHDLGNMYRFSIERITLRSTQVSLNQFVHHRM